MKTISGLDRFIMQCDRYQKRNIGLIVNQTSVSSDLKYSWQILAKKGLRIHKIFSPEHGLYATEQDQVAVTSQQPGAIPVVSLYGSDYQSLFPNESDLQNIDLLIFDIQDIGTRYYTFVITLAYILRRLHQKGLEILVLDRPNPINGQDIDGTPLEADYHSFVGEISVPVRHGLTAAELARYYVFQEKLDLPLDTFPMENWRRGDDFDHTELPWVMPSPNMPDIDTAYIYPGMCLLEATNISEGRGTTRPFLHCGAPFIDPDIFCAALQRYALPGIVFRPTYFKPTFHKYKEMVVGGAFLHITDRRVVPAFLVGIAITKIVHDLYPQHFSFLRDGYEFNTSHPAFDILSGSSSMRTMIEQGASLEEIAASYQTYLHNFSRNKQQWHIYHS